MVVLGRALACRIRQEWVKKTCPSSTVEVYPCKLKVTIEAPFWRQIHQPYMQTKSFDVLYFTNEHSMVLYKFIYSIRAHHGQTMSFLSFWKKKKKIKPPWKQQSFFFKILFEGQNFVNGLYNNVKIGYLCQLSGSKDDIKPFNRVALLR